MKHYKCGKKRKGKSKVFPFLLGNIKNSSYISSVIRDMQNEIYIEGIGWVREITISRLNENGVNEPYVQYELINK